MDSPYTTALIIPFLLSRPCLVKKETVSGIIGKTQGVSNAINPPIKPRIKMPQIVFSRSTSSPQLFNG